jgi:multidrug efflux pump subunit AcrA (membrane-fusion protein)
VSIRGRNLLALSIALAGALLAVALGQGRPVPAETPGESVPLLVRVAQVAPRAHRFRVRTHGTVAPRTESDLVAEVAGRVVWASPALAAGGFFEEGERLLEVDRRDYANAVARTRAHVARAKSELGLASVDLERLGALAERNVASASALERARNAERVARAALAEARTEVERAERDLERTRIEAPFAGRVRDKRVDVGQFVARGTPVARVYAVDFAEVRLPVRDADLGFLDLPIGYRGEADPKQGPEVVLRARFAGRPQEWRARVVRTEGAEILGRVMEDVLVVPRSAVRADGTLLFVDGEDRLRLRRAEILRNEGQDAVVRAAPEPSERLCLSPIDHAVEGMLVRPVAEGPGAESGRGSLAVARQRP